MTLYNGQHDASSLATADLKHTESSGIVSTHSLDLPDLRHFLDIDQLDSAVLRSILTQSQEMKQAWQQARQNKPLAGYSLAMIFQSPSTRTRVSFEVAMRQLGGDVVMINAQESQLGRGESFADTARVLSRYVDIIMLRTKSVSLLEELVQHATVPVINGLTDYTHPCQVMADIMTFEEHRGHIEGRKIAWSGDGNNVALSWIHAAVRFNFHLKLACPINSALSSVILEWASRTDGRVSLTQDPHEALADADCVVTDTWVSMHESDEDDYSHLAPFRVDEALLAYAKPEAIFMHCLPAYRGREVSAGVIDGPQSVVWDEAENRLHVQKAILNWCLDK